MKKESVKRAAVTALAFTLAPFPALADTSTAAWTAPAPVTGNQAGSQSNAGNANNMASMLGKAAGVLSMASGGLFIAKGAQELSCCMQGCNTQAGTQSQASKAAQDIDAANKAKGINVYGPTKRQPVDYKQLRFPDGAWNCPAPARAPFLLLDFLKPPRAEASGCLDGMLALATGGLMLLNGMLGLAAANQAGQNGATALGNADNMGTLPGSIDGTSPTGSHANNGGPGSSTLGPGGAAGSQIKLDPALLRTGTANDIMGQFEHKFGIGRDDFAQGVLGGEDPRKLFATAPKNALTVGDMNKAVEAAKNMSDDDKVKALANTQLAAAQAELSAKVDGAGAVDQGGSRAPAGKGLFDKDKGEEQLTDLDAVKPGAQPALDDLQLSPEVKAALLAKQAAEHANDWQLLSLFQRVHGKYREKSKMIFGFDPDQKGGEMKGVGNAEGN